MSTQTKVAIAQYCIWHILPHIPKPIIGALYHYHRAHRQWAFERGL